VNVVRVSVSGDYYVNVVGATVHGMEMPSSNMTMIINSFLDERSLF
jgi:hypothetical protein